MIRARRGMKQLIRFTAIWLVIFQMAIFFLVTANARSGAINPDSGAQYLLNHGTHVTKILAVLENKIEDQQVLKRTKEKLFTLNDQQTRLIASLSDRAAREGNAPGSDIAFLLMTALITLL